MRISSAIVLVAALLFIVIENVRAQGDVGPFSQGIYVWMSSSSISLPILRGPDEHLEMPVSQSGTTNGFAGGYEWLWNHIGVGVGGAYWKLKMQDFRFDIFQGTGSPSDQSGTFEHITKILSLGLRLSIEM